MHISILVAACLLGLAVSDPQISQNCAHSGCNQNNVAGTHQPAHGQGGQHQPEHGGQHHQGVHVPGVHIPGTHVPGVHVPGWYPCSYSSTSSAFSSTSSAFSSTSRAFSLPSFYLPELCGVPLQPE